MDVLSVKNADACTIAQKLDSKEVAVTEKIRRIFISAGVLLGLVIAVLGFQTRSSHLLGWLLFVFGLGCCVLGSLYLGRWFNGAQGRTFRRSFWLIAPAVLLAGLLPPLEYLFLGALLPRGENFGNLGLVLGAAGLLLLVGACGWLLRRQPTGQGQPRINRLARCVLYTGLALLATGSSLSYASLVGLLVVLALLLPGLTYRALEDARLFI